ncbi:hypothetical protein D1AOALGA4SA_233 [Olavius algarvensis Delta 1 endosymbiont]|nr:hypothetical protein D1AOALGA4SA_233 [Olavius algarvensis Delta 1 endosymbiont]
MLKTTIWQLKPTRTKPLCSIALPKITGVLSLKINLLLLQEPIG